MLSAETEAWCKKVAGELVALKREWEQKRRMDRAELAELAELDLPTGTGGAADDATLSALEENALDFTERCMTIRSDDTLGEIQKAEALKAAYERARRKYEALRNRFVGDIEPRRERLYNRALRPKGSALNKETVMMSYRDALARAQALDPYEIVALAKSYQRAGDETGRRACAATLYEQGLGDLAAVELEDEVLQALLDFDQQYPKGWTESRLARLSWANPDRPSEIDRARLTGVGGLA